MVKNRKTDEAIKIAWLIHIRSGFRFYLHGELLRSGVPLDNPA
jgi:hypothetical protein